MLVAALFVHPLHRRIHCVAADTVKSELTEGKPGPDSYRVGGISAAPGRPLADQQTAGRPAISPVDPVQADEADMAARPRR